MGNFGHVKVLADSVPDEFAGFSSGATHCVLALEQRQSFIQSQQLDQCARVDGPVAEPPPERTESRTS
jgi:hypothetical protein